MCVMCCSNILSDATVTQAKLSLRHSPSASQTNKHHLLYRHSEYTGPHRRIPIPIIYYIVYRYVYSFGKSITEPNFSQIKLTRVWYPVGETLVNYFI